MPSQPPAMLKSQPANTCLWKKKKKRSHSREHCHAILGGFISDLTWGKQPGVNTSSPTLTRCTCSKFNSQSYGFECGTAWVSEFLSFDFTQYETQGLNLPGRATQHPGWGLILCAVSFAVVHIVRARGVFSQMPPPQPDTVCISSAVFFFPAKKKKKKNGNETRPQPLLWVKSVVLSLLLI